MLFDPAALQRIHSHLRSEFRSECFADTAVVVEAGVILAVLHSIQKITVTTTVSEVTHGYIAEGFEDILQ